MGNWRSVGMALVALAQIGSPPDAIAQSRGGQDAMVERRGGRELLVTISKCTPPADAVPPLPMAPLKEDVTAVIIVTIERDLTISIAGVGVSSGDAARDQALIDHVKKNWRLAGCGEGQYRFRVHFSHVTCAPQPLPETQTEPELDEYPDRPRSTQMEVALVPDGKVQSATVTRSSGDAALDRAAVAHVIKAWRWQPFSCPEASAVVTGAATINFPYQAPEPPPR